MFTRLRVKRCIPFKTFTCERNNIMKNLVIVTFVLLFVTAISGGALFGGESYNPYAAKGFQIASLNHPEESPDMSTNDENPDTVYEATKNLHTTGIPQDVNIATWRLRVEGEKVLNPLSLSYEELKKMKMVRKEVTLICPGVFTDYAEWEGVLLSDILDMARIQDGYKRVIVHGLDNYRSSFSPEEIDTHLIFLALKVNGVTLPKEHGYPARIVAEELAGNKWVKWVDSIEVK
jgi:DMSO/TMAO reductase YedYZ molybdopterin-dependent catalytic subunit